MGGGGGATAVWVCDGSRENERLRAAKAKERNGTMIRRIEKTEE